MRAKLLQARVREALRRRRGAASLEIACVFPFFTVMLLGGVEVTQLVRVYMGLGMATQGMADILSHGDPDTAAQILDACNGAKLMMAPFTGTTFKAAIANVKNTGGTLSVSWSDTSCGTATAIPTATATSSATSLVPNSGDEATMVTSTYTFTAATSMVMSPTYTFTYTAFARPRPP